VVQLEVKEGQPVVGPDFEVAARGHGDAPEHADSAKVSASDKEHIAWVGRCLNDFTAIKPGMTRQEVEGKFKLDGGLQSASPVRFVHPACPYFKIEVEFDFRQDHTNQGRAITAKDDKVIRVSKPYLEAPFMD